MHVEPWQQTIEEYMGKAPVSDFSLPDEVKPAAIASLKRAGLRLKKWRRHPYRGDLAFAVLPHSPRRPGGVFIRSRETGEVIAGYADAPYKGGLMIVPLVLDAFKGKGLGKEMTFLVDQVFPGFRYMNESYTPSGFPTYRATHRLHVERALRDGKNVPDHVRAQYDFENGALALKVPYTIAAHNAQSSKCDIQRIFDKIDNGEIGPAPSTPQEAGAAAPFKAEETNPTDPFQADAPASEEPLSPSVGSL